MYKVTSNATPLKARQSLSLGHLKCRVRSVKVSTNDFWDFRKSSYKEVFMVFFLHYLNEEKRGAQNQRYRKTIHEKWCHILRTILYIKRYPPNTWENATQRHLIIWHLIFGIRKIPEIFTDFGYLSVDFRTFISSTHRLVRSLNSARQPDLGVFFVELLVTLRYLISIF